MIVDFDRVFSKTSELKDSTKSFAKRILRLVRSLPSGMESHVIGYQLLRSGTSVAANYRAVCRARSRADFVSKLGIVIEEADESALWLELLSETGIVPAVRLANLQDEANQLVAILNASKATAKRNS